VVKEIIYLIGSLRLPTVREFAKELRAEGFEVFDDWHAAGPEADDIWQKYEQDRGHTYLEAMKGYHAEMVFRFDERHLSRAGLGVLMLPAGKSAHLELGYMLGKGKRGYVLFDKEPERFDVMYLFASGLFLDKAKLIEELKHPGAQHVTPMKEFLS
jgi:hypothetical protein